jgi:predicted DNA-binding transcriptional regulator YafY
MPTFNREVLSQYSTPIRQAILNKSKVDIDYIRQDGTASTRRICPLGMVYWGHAWTLIAWCENRNDYRMFRFDRIQQLQITSDHFITSDTCNLQHYMAQQPC